LLLICLAWIPTVARLYLAASQFLASEGRALVAQLPEITITGGVVSTPSPGPHVIRSPANGLVLATIDTE
jgi:hypothetical protein